MTVTSNTGSTTGRTRTSSRAAVVGAAVLAALAVWAVLSQLLGVELETKRGSSMSEIGGVAVAVAAGVMSLAGWGLLDLLERRSPQARRTWTIVALAFTAVSLLGPLGSGVGAGSKVGLAALHLAVAAVVVPGLRRTSPRRS